MLLLEVNDCFPHAHSILSVCTKMVQGMPVNAIMWKVVKITMVFLAVVRRFDRSAIEIW